MKSRLVRCAWAAMVAVIAGTVTAQQAPPPSSPEQLDQLLAPIALYPDALIIQLVQCAASPYQVKKLHDWLKSNPDLKGSAAQEAAAKEGFDASFVAIVLFPQIVQNLAEQTQWTQSLGQAFTAQRDAMFASIQRLRGQAESAGNLKSTDQQQIQSVKTESGDTVIVIQPANPQVVYVPHYDPQTVYVQPAPLTGSTDKSDDTGEKVAIGLISFAAGVIVGGALDDDDDHFYYAYGGWGYARPICYPGGYHNYYEHRENMAKDYYRHRENMANNYYDHREDMAGTRGENQGQRQDARGDRVSTHQDTRAGDSTARQDARVTNQLERQGSRATSSPSSQEARTANQPRLQASQQGAATRGAFQPSSSGSQNSETRSSAFGGYQRGSTERASSARGHSSQSGSVSANRSGSRTGGGRSGGGRR